MVTFRITFLRLAVPCLGLVALLVNGCGGTSSPKSSPAPSAQADNADPTITSITPATATAGAAQLSIAVSGTGFVSSSAVRWNGTAIATTFSTDTSVTATVPAVDVADGGTAAITVFNPAPGGGSSAAASFTVNNPAPVIAGVNPASVVAGAATQTLDLMGTGFVPSSSVAWNGSSLATLWVSATELKATLPASALGGSSASAVTVQNPAPGGGTSAVEPFNVTSPTPVLTSISPQIVPAGLAATITLTGTGFETNSVVEWNGAPRTTTFVSATTLQVSLSTADLQNVKSGSLTVTNPGPNSSTSGSAPLATTNQPFPTITGMSISAAPNFTPCQQLQITVTGKNFDSRSIIQVNGVTLQPMVYGGDLTTLVNFLPPGLVTKPGGLSVTVSDPGSPSLVSEPFVYPLTSPTVLAICATPSTATVYPQSSFTIMVQPTEVNATGTEQLSLGNLPAGLTVTNSTMSLPATGAPVHFQAAASLAAGNYTIPLQATAGPATASGNLALNVSTGTVPGFSFITPLPREVAIPIGGSGSITFETNVSPGVDYDITPSVSGLPAGTSASFSPATFSVGQNVTVTITAAANAPVTQNATVTLTGTPSASVAPSIATFYADVTQPPGSLPNSRTDFTPTWGTLYGAAYDPAHDLIFASNVDWNRVDVLSNKTHKLVKSIPVPDPRGVDISQDNASVWVTTQSQQVVRIDPVRLTATRYLLPPYQNSSWEGNQVEALADGTLLLGFSQATGDGSFYSAVWNPSNNAFTALALPSNAQPGLGFGPWKRSGDGSKAYSFNADSSTCQILEYDVASKSVTAAAGFNEVCGLYAVNQDGSRIVAANGAAVGLYDGSFHLLGTIFPDNPAVIGYFSGSFIFSSNGNSLYEVSGNRITTIDTASVTVAGTAPAITPGDQFWTGTATSPGPPFAVDANGMLLDIQVSGIGFEDATFFQSYGTNSVPQPSAVTLSAYSGPLSGGTAVSPYGYFGLTPDVWFGETRGTASVDATLTVTSPPSNTPGPVNLKYLFPDGAQLFSPQVFTYSVFPQYGILSGGSPDGGEPGSISGFGLPTDPSNGSMTVGGNNATITTKTSQYLPFTGEAFPTTYLDFTVPPGSPGFADIDVTTPAGTGTLTRGFFYARSVKDYSSSDTFTAVLIDKNRQQVYLTAGDHVDVFSIASNAFTNKLYPAALGNVKQFTGLALTPDGSELLVTDLADGSLAVINPDSPGITRAIAIAPANAISNTCTVGPLYVAAMSGNRAMVVTGGLPGYGCGPGGATYLADLSGNTSSHFSACSNGVYVDSSADGNLVGLAGGFCIYNVAANAFFTAGFYQPYGMTVAGDGNAIASQFVITDAQAHITGRLAHPEVFYGSFASSLGYSANSRLRPRLNAAGSLYFWAYPNYLEIVDVLHAKLLMRFSLAETVQATASPIAIDSGGRHVYLITDKGLTVVDLGEAPLAIGHLSQQIAGAGTQVMMRGSGFDASVIATVGGEPASVNITDENTLTLTVPAVASGPEDIVLMRGDGATYTYENGLTLP